jgi:Protein of unknown function (DUF2752)
MGPDATAVLAADDIVVPAHVDERRRRRRMLAPLATGAAVLGGLGYLAAVDPSTPGHYPLCPTRALFGVDCPGCGALRGTHDLVTGNLAGALDHNVLLIVFLPLAVVLWVRWLRRAWTGLTPAVSRAVLQRRTTVLITVLVAVLAFGVIRNFVPYLGSGIG